MTWLSGPILEATPYSLFLTHSLNQPSASGLATLAFVLTSIPESIFFTATSTLKSYVSIHRQSATGRGGLLASFHSPSLGRRRRTPLLLPGRVAGSVPP